MVETHTISNRSGISATFIRTGASVVRLIVPDERGRHTDVTLALSDLDGYGRGVDPYFGCIVGRYANRIDRGRFSLGGQTHHLSVNDGQNTLHGGKSGWNLRQWDVVSATAEGIVFGYESKAGEEGFPGSVYAEAAYVLTDGQSLVLSMTAAPTEPTPVNLTNHMYFNLNGAGHGSVLQHGLFVDANSYLPVNGALIPTGEIRAVGGSPFDFTFEKKVGRDIQLVDGGYDHTFAIRNWDGTSLRRICSLHGDISGIALDISATQPGLQVYTGNFLDGTICGIGGCYMKYGGIALEPHYFPDSPNRPEFPSAIFGPGREFRETIRYDFSNRR